MNRSLLYTQYLGFISLGFILSIISPLIVSIRSDISMSYMQSGMILTGQFLGALITVTLGGYLADRFGKKPFLLAGSVLIAAGLLASAAASSFQILMTACLIVGVGAGSYEVGINALMADHTESESGKAMNFLHFFFGIGAITAPLVATLILSQNISWRAAFIFATLLPVTFGAAISRQKVKRTNPHAVKSQPALYRNGTLWLFGLILLIYVGIETSTYSWISSFWKRLPDATFPPQSIIASIFWITLTSGRLICGLITDRIGLIRFIAISSIATLVSGTVWTFFPNREVTLACIFVIGFSLSGIYPTIMAIMTRLFPGRSGKVVAFMTVFGSIGGFFIPSIIGRAADSYSISILPPFIAVLSLAMCMAINAGTIYASFKLVSKKILSNKGVD
jgi:fucose permease